MKFTLSWLKDHLDTGAALDEIVETLTRIGLEVESVEDKAKGFSRFTRRAGDRGASSIRTPTACGSASSTPGRASRCRSCAGRRTRAPA